MRYSRVLIGVWLAATAAYGRPIATPRPAPQAPVLLDLNGLHLHLFHQPQAADIAPEGPAGGGATSWSRQGTTPDLSMGPLRAQIGTDDDPWANLPSYRSELGSSAWEGQENKSRSAKLLFVWPTDK